MHTSLLQINVIVPLIHKALSQHLSYTSLLFVFVEIGLAFEKKIYLNIGVCAVTLQNRINEINIYTLTKIAR